MRGNRGIAVAMAVAMFCVWGEAGAATQSGNTKPKAKVVQVKKSAAKPQARKSNGSGYNPRYAALILDPQTGEILYSKEHTAKRHPASLTKMMTLYLTFEALKNGRMRLDTPLRVSKYAASRPQTNLSLKAGQTIPVEVAIKALVVRSANDVSVVVAETLAKSEAGFAAKMTLKARELGMASTVFRNANGLPDPAQITTAADMAKLGIALRRDFPQYYRYFETRSFSWAGVTYRTHNNVMTRYAGVDGIKTGFIRASGFNLVTSVRRNNRNLVGVVMGGSSARWRDDHMIALLNSAYTKLAKRGDQQPKAYAAASLPKPVTTTTPVAEPVVQTAAATPAAPAPLPATERARLVIQPVNEITEARVAAAIAAPAPVPAPQPEITVAGINPQTQPVTVRAEARPMPSAPPQVPTPLADAAPEKPLLKREAVNFDRNTLQFQLANIQTGASAPSHGGISGAWGIQVGAFANAAQARQAAVDAMRRAPSELKSSTIAVKSGSAGSSVHRARIANLSESQAKTACQRLIASKSPCFVYRADTENGL